MRDATTDGDHVTKEHIRLKSIKDAGYKPVRIMFYYPNRIQSIRIQETLKTVYSGLEGAYYVGGSAWSFVKQETGVDLLTILETLAQKKMEG